MKVKVKDDFDGEEEEIVINPSDLPRQDYDTPRLSSEQQHAVEICCDRSIPIAGVTGGAGTGKTFVLGKAYEELKRNKKNTVVLAAPTGRAAKRVQELTGIPAVTVHRLLEYPLPDEYSDDPNEPKRGINYKLDYNTVIVDESSMVSPRLYRNLMNALPDKGIIRFFGDNNQLPPVNDAEDQGKRAPFYDVLEKYPSVELSFNYRSDDELVARAQQILMGRIPTKSNRFQIFWSDNPMKFLLDFVKGEKVFADDTHQIIIPTRKGKAGTQKFNPSLQTRFNPRGPMLKLDRFDDSEPPLGIRSGDKFLWIKNDYKLNLFNGEIGRVEWVDPESGELRIRTPERSLLVPARLKTFSPWHGTVINYDPRKQLELGYGITTHKSQGSEFDTVIYTICRAHAYLLNRRNFYTAVTRAKRQVIVICDRKAMGLSMKPWSDN